ncbi:hypothetical protein LB506_002904 [Fusarium annulatum]|nr:hypothetical protein LB506_002904 [Fusarium annulatum]
MLGGNGRARNRLFLAFRFFWPPVRLHFGRSSEVAPYGTLECPVKLVDRIIPWCLSMSSAHHTGCLFAKEKLSQKTVA